MKKKLLVVAVMVLAAVVSCNNGLTGSGGRMAEKGGNERKDKSRRTVIDDAAYIDFTLVKNNAAKFTRQDLLMALNGTYYREGGNSYIKVDRQRGEITISSDNAFYKGEKGQNMYAKYLFDVDAANNDCLYIKPEKTKRANLLIGSDSFSGHETPELTVCLPLYGYSRRRIEVSPVMDGYIAMPSGTYWLERK